MMRALWTGASGMNAQQTNLDTIANNFSNIATTGYKKETAQFASLLYQKIQTKTTDNEGNKKPVIGQVGLGVRNTAIVSQFSQGSLQESDNNWDMAVEGNGFFMVQQNDGTTAYTRNGSFGLAIGGDGVTLANADGFAVLDSKGEPITFTNTVMTATLTKIQELEKNAGIEDDSKSTEFDYNNVDMDDYGNLTYTSNNNISVNLGIKIGLAQFNNPAGLEKLSGSLFGATENSGEVRLENEDSSLKKSKIHQGYLEGSNVDTANEIVNLIVAQRAYEMNSKTISAADEMLQQANNLKR